MISPGTEVFLRPDGPRDDRLLRARVTGFHRDVCEIVLSDPSAAGRAGRRVLVHYELDGKFVRRSAVVETTAAVTAELRVTGAVEPAERRRKPRVSYLHLLQQVVQEPILAQ